MDSESLESSGEVNTKQGKTHSQRQRSRVFTGEQEARSSQTQAGTAMRDPHGPGKFQSHCHQTDDPLDGEGTDEHGYNLLGLHLERKVPVGKNTTR